MPKGKLIATFTNGPFQRIHQSINDIKEKWSGDQGAARAYPIEIKTPCDHEVTQLNRFIKGKVCEVGCGTGRIAKYIDPNKYIGVDINPSAIAITQKKNPSHKFSSIEWNASYPIADTYLFYTVFLHIPDNFIANLINKLSGRVIIVESMGRWKRDYLRTNDYQRDPADFRTLMINNGLKEIAFSRVYDIRYPCEINFQVFE